MHDILFIILSILNTIIFLQIDRHIDVAFNSLDLTVNLQTWVVVFEFFGIGAPPPLSTASGQTSPTKSLDVSAEFEGNYFRPDSLQRYYHPEFFAGRG